MSARWLMSALVGLLLCSAPAWGNAVIKIDEQGEGVPNVTWVTDGQITSVYNLVVGPETARFEFDLVNSSWGGDPVYYSTLLEADGSLSDVLLIEWSNPNNIGHAVVQFGSDPAFPQIPTNAVLLYQLIEDGTFQTMFAWMGGSNGSIQVASDLDVIPLPAAAWMGLALMGGLAILRRRAA
jgi:hypothetical protein